MAATDRVYVPLDEWLEIEEWPMASLLPDELDNVLIAPPEPAAGGAAVTIPLALLAKRAHLFLNYSSRDRDKVRAVHRYLSERGITTFFDQQNLRAAAG